MKNMFPNFTVLRESIGLLSESLVADHHIHPVLKLRCFNSFTYISPTEICSSVGSRECEKSCKLSRQLVSTADSGRKQ